MNKLTIVIEGDRVTKQDLIYELRDAQEQMMAGYQYGKLVIMHKGKNNQWYDRKGFWEIKFEEDKK